MADHYLKFADAGEAATELQAAGITVNHAPGWAVDPVGTIWSDPVLDEAGEVVTPAAPLPGWHVNIRLRSGSLATALQAFEVTPSTPSRRFAS
tara:strand:- start:135 stop:413 length:279 start_codon:yes stop_codon:yes gene_type:complete